MRKRSSFILFFFYFGLITYSQTLSVKFNNIFLSQNSNAYCYAAADGTMMFSSIDGLNIYDGLHTRVYRPLTHNMVGNNVQSTFFQDSSGYIWFTTYEALHRYYPARDELQHWYLTSSKGDTIKENYMAFFLEKESLYLKAGEEIFVFNTTTQTKQSNYPINFSEVYSIAVSRKQSSTMLFGGSDEGYSVYGLEVGNRAKLILSGNEYVSYVCPASDSRLWIGYGNGDLALFDPHSQKNVFRQSISETRIRGISTYGDSELFISLSSGGLVEYDINARQILRHVTPINNSTQDPIKQPYFPYVGLDSTLWIGGDGQGVFFIDLNKQKFKHLLKAPTGQQPISIVRILQRTDHTYIVLTRKNGIIHIDQNGNILQKWQNLPPDRANFTAISGILLDDDNILFSAYFKLYQLSISSNRIVPITCSPLELPLQFDQIERLPNGRIICGTGEEGMFEIDLKGHDCMLQSFTDVTARSKMITSFKTDQQSHLYISNDQINILVYTLEGQNYTYSYTLPIKDGITSVEDVPEQNAVYITNYNGLYYLDHNTQKFTRVRDAKNHLLQSLYAGLMDQQGHLWLSSNTGLLRYSPKTEEVIVFSEMDGVQSSEFNTNAYLKTAEGIMLFGGVNGLNIFDPEQVRLSQKRAMVYVNEVLINDEPDTFYKVPQYVTEYKLPYHRNTISFEFHAIDYADPTATRVRYKLIGVDDEYVESKSAQGFARYANLLPGSYIFTILGQNADGVWNEVPRELPIIIYPPFYLTWWFISITSIAAISLFYYIIRSYYRRKLEKKNQLLREQSLIIEKQQAIERERTRIASEMHDDLGSGLTTIRYLSDKALMQAKDPEELEQIQRIADHSNTLVQNMSEIIWAMNSRYDDAENLVGYLRRYASEYLDEHQIPLEFDIDERQWDEINVGGEVRRNLFLVFKEVLHNTVKYSGATQVIVKVDTGDEITIHVIEAGGKGFDPASSEREGNGLYNCRKRMDFIHGRISFEKTPEAMHIIFSAPINTTT